MKLGRTLGLLEGDGPIVLTLGALHFLVAAAHSLFDIGVTSLLVARLGPDTLPEVYIGSALALMLVGVFIIPVIDRLDRVWLFSAILAIFAALLLVSLPLASRAPEWIYRELYVACFVMKSLVFLQFWLLAGDLLDIRQAKRLFPVLLGFSLLGGLVASLAASLKPDAVATETLLQVAAGLMLLGILPAIAVARGQRPPRRAPRQVVRLGETWASLRSDLRVALSTSLLRTLSLCVLLLALLAQVFDFLMGQAAYARFTGASGIDVEALTSFYALLNAGVIGAGVFLQLVLANRILSSIGVTRGLLLAPLSLLAGFLLTGVAWLAGGGLLGRGFFQAVVGSRATQKVLRISLVRNSTDLVFNAIPSERRGRAKAFKETVTEPTGVLLSGLFLLAGAQVPMQYVIGGAIAVSAFFLIVTLRLKEDYVESLVHVLKERSRFRYAFPSIVMRAVNAPARAPQVSGIRRALDDDAASVRLLAVEVASDLKEPEAASLLVERYQEEPDPDVRARMVAALGKMLRQSSGDDVGQESLSDVDPRVRASGMASMAESGIFHIENLTAEAGKSEPTAKAEAPTPEPLPAPSPAVEPQVEAEPERARPRREVFLDLARSGENEALERLVHYMEEGDGATRHLAARALETLGEPALDVLTLALWSTDVEGRRYVIRALDRIGTERARQAVLPALSLEAEEAYYDLLRLEALNQLDDHPALELLKDALVQRAARAKENAHRILRAAFIAEPGMRLILSNLNHPDRFVRSSAIEALDLRVEGALLGGILPLFEHENLRTIAEDGSSYFDMPQRSPHEVVAELTGHRSPWVRATAIYVAGQLGDARYVETLCGRVSDPDELARLNAIEAIGRIGDLTTVAVLESAAAEASGRARDYAVEAVARVRARA